MYDIISRSAVFKNVSPSEIEQILSETHHQIKKYAEETIIAYSGSKCENFYVLIEGSVSGEVGNLKDKRIKIEDIQAPDSFAEAFLFASESNLLVNIVTNTPAKVLVIYKEDLLKLFQRNSQILENYLEIISNRFVLVTKKIKFLSLKTIKGKAFSLAKSALMDASRTTYGTDLDFDVLAVNIAQE